MKDDIHGVLHAVWSSTFAIQTFRV